MDVTGEGAWHLKRRKCWKGREYFYLFGGGNKVTEGDRGDRGMGTGLIVCKGEGGKEEGGEGRKEDNE